ncbi:hypothetical protein SIO17_12810 [Pseudoalteromonas piscicida]|uniref:hypothetical protein n=1 Tax=Pseudoalteromonas piscicida TaxID=43662 RepID=UPI00026CFE2F|nr:hypothetical protein [Pseudoalteromonas piscicida]WPU34506.1 hypothetical protein SIO17_12810 [Pseudoalteromonas piscicida]
MSNSEVLLGLIMKAVETEELLSTAEVKSVKKLVLSGKVKEEDWLTALENTHFKEGEDHDLEA